MKSCNDGKDKMNLFENLGDFFNDIECPEKAVDFYKQQVIANNFNLAECHAMFFFSDKT